MCKDTRETSLNFGTGQTVVRYQATTHYGSSVLPDLTIIKTLDGFTQIIDGIHYSIEPSEVPPALKMAFDMFEQSDNPPQYPYTVKMLGDK